MDQILFTENIINNSFIHKPPKNFNAVDKILSQALEDNDQYKEAAQIL